MRWGKADLLADIWWFCVFNWGSIWHKVYILSPNPFFLNYISLYL